MKTTNDFKDILPTLINLFSNEDHQIGVSEYGHDEYESNNFIYEEDGWYVEVNYECCGEYVNEAGDYWTPPCFELIRGWGRVSEITVIHTDDETGEETEFCDEEMQEIIAIFDEELRDIA